MRCSRCHESLTAGARFCAQCGARVVGVHDGPAAALADAEPSPGRRSGTATEAIALRAERRHVTVMFCDLVGSTALSTRLDPEELSRLLVVYRTICIEATRQWEGLVASFSGDGVMVYFGYPMAHEDDPERAVLAAHRILREIAAYNARRAPLEEALAVRIGISSGLVVIGEIGSGDVVQNRGVVGEAPNVAARTQSHARPGQVVISDATRALLDEAFACESLGEFALAGIDRPVTLYRVADTAPPAERFLRLRRRGLVPIVGRTAEKRRLLVAWQRVRAGETVALGLHGDAGVGKSRLVWALREHLRGGHGSACRHRALVLNCSPYHSSTAWHPWLDALAERPDRAGRVAVGRLSRLLHHHAGLDGAVLERTAAALQALLRGERGRGNDGGTPASPIREALLRVLVGLSRKAPLLLLVEDAHWIDPSTADVLVRLVREHPRERILLLVTSRQPGSLGKTAAIECVELGPLDAARSRALVRSALGGRTLPEEWLDRLATASDGNPLHIEELARHVEETGLWCRAEEGGEVPAEESAGWLPTSLRALFMSRLDRLESGKALLQTAAVLGRRFSRALLHRLYGGSLDELARTLCVLSESALVRPVAGTDLGLYEFHHALLRDAAYRSMLLRDRQRLHRAVTRALLDEDARSLETRPELLAFHHTRGGERSRAIEAWRRAGLRAQRLSANTEAVEHFQQALDLVGDDDARGTLERRLSLLIRQGPSMMAARSWASIEVERLYDEIVDISRRIDDRSRLFVGHRGLWGTAMLRGRIDDAVAIVDILAALADELDNPALRLEARMCEAANHFWRGEMGLCERRMSRVMGDYDPGLHGAHAYRFSVDPGVLSRFYLAIVRWYRGDAAQARSLMRRAVSLARDQQHHPSLAWALGFEGWLALLRDAPEEARRVASRSARLCVTHDLPLYGAWAEVLLGAAELLGARERDGLERLRRGTDDYLGIGAGVALPVFLGLRARGELALGEADAALATLARASLFARRHGIGVVTADLWLLRARALQLAATGERWRSWRCLRVAWHLASRQGKAALAEQVVATARGCAHDDARRRELDAWTRTRTQVRTAEDATE